MNESGRARVIADLRRVGHRIFSGAVGGFLCGLIVGGVGGRLAMLLLRVTTGPEVIGLESDDGFTMGAFTGDTLFLVGATAFMGAFVGVIYSVVRGWIPERIRPGAVAALVGLAGGAAVVHPEGVDFTALSPRSLAIALFVLLPALYGYAVSRAVDRLLERQPGRVFPWIGLAMSLFGVIVIGVDGGLIGPVLVLAVVAASIVALKFPQIRSIPTMPAVVWVARTALIAGGVYAAALLVKDTIEIL